MNLYTVRIWYELVEDGYTYGPYALSPEFEAVDEQSMRDTAEIMVQTTEPGAKITKIDILHVLEE